MKEQEFKKWLGQKYPNNSTVLNRVSNCKKIEKVYGNLDDRFDENECITILQDLIYTVNDERNNRPAKHKITIDGDIRTGSATLKQALKLYVSFREDFFEDEKEYLNSEIIEKLNRDLTSIGKSTFVKYFYEFKKGHNKASIIDIFNKNKETWGASSKSTKANVGIKIFSDGYEKEALNIILSSCRIDEETIVRVNEIYSEEYSDYLNKNYVFIRPEFTFGEELIDNLFSNYKVNKGFKVLNYELDWYIPELKLAIEFDEKHHKRSKDQDGKRQKKIEEHLKCRFIRYSM